MINQTQTIKTRGVTDITFCLDCTGSMGGCIDNVKNNMSSLVRGFNSVENVSLDWRVRAMGFRDFEEDSTPLINDTEFTDDAEAFVKQFDEMKAMGGGDGPESSLDAIVYAINTSAWRHNAHHVVVLFTDAPSKSLYHGTQSNFGFPASIDYLKQTLTEKRIQLFVFCGSSCSLLSQLSDVPLCQVNQGCNLNSSADFAPLMEAIGKTVALSSTLAKSPTL